MVKDDTEEMESEERPLYALRDIRERNEVANSTVGDSRKVVSGGGPQKVYRFSIDGKVSLPDPDSLVRVIIEDTAGNEYLVYEAYLLVEGKESLSVKDACEETCLLDGIKIKDVIVETESSGDIKISKLNKSFEERKVTASLRRKKRLEVLSSKVDDIERVIKNRDLKWEAGITPFAKLSYEEKSDMYGGEVPNFQGLEFYKGGVFQTLENKTNSYQVSEILNGKSDKDKSSVISKIREFFVKEVHAYSGDAQKVLSSSASSAYVASWDWRERHGADDSTSYYFDGNPDRNESGNGWMTEIKDQASCGSCWAFAATGATESLVNVYFNRHYDLDLAEQDGLSCSGAGSCSGGWPGVTLDYYTDTGVVNEGCFPYTATDQPCSNKCNNPTERIKISGRVPFSDKTEDNLKSLIIQYGPISGGVYSWSHAMTLLGWYTDGVGDTVWIFKNSWGKSWGDGGYLNLKTAISNIGWTHALVSPPTSNLSRSIRCVDADGDGYYNWGLSSSKPASCPDGTPDLKDCDDSNANLVMFDSKYDCVALQSDISVAPGTSNFGGIPVGQVSDEIEVAISNEGQASLDISDITLGDNTNFALNLTPSEAATSCDSTTTSIESGNACSIGVTFTPQAERSYSTNLIVNSNDENVSSYSVPLRGYGTYNAQTVCSYFEGDWLQQRDTCFGISQDNCDTYRGALKQCDSYCPDGKYCALSCVESCVF